jgi:hypothetical protein
MDKPGRTVVLPRPLVYNGHIPLIPCQGIDQMRPDKAIATYHQSFFHQGIFSASRIIFSPYKKGLSSDGPRLALIA